MQSNIPRLLLLTFALLNAWHLPAQDKFLSAHFGPVRQAAMWDLDEIGEQIHPYWVGLHGWTGEVAYEYPKAENRFVRVRASFGVLGLPIPGWLELNPANVSQRRAAVIGFGSTAGKTVVRGQWRFQYGYDLGCQVRVGGRVWHTTYAEIGTGTYEEHFSVDAAGGTGGIVLGVERFLTDRICLGLSARLEGHAYLQNYRRSIYVSGDSDWETRERGLQFRAGGAMMPLLRLGWRLGA